MKRKFWGEIIRFTIQYTNVLNGKWKRFLCPRHKMARGHLVFALSVIPSFRPSVLLSFRHSVILSFRHSVPSKFVFSTPPTSLLGFEWNLLQMLGHKSRSACGEIIHVRQILAELWSLTLRIFTHFSFSFSTPPTSLHGFEWNLVQMLGYKSRSACGEIIYVQQILAELWSLKVRIFYIF